MAPPKQRWTSEEEASVRAGVAKYKVGKWRAILNDPQFSSTLCCRSNVDLKDKWRNMNVTAISSASREKGRASREKERTSRVKKIPSAPKKDHHALAISIKEKWHNMNATALAAASREGRTALKAISIVTSDINDKIVDDPSKKPKSSVKYLKFKEAPVKVDAELVRMATMTAEEAAAATRAVAEAAALIKEARKAVKEAEAAEADAQAAQAFAEAAFLTLKNRNATN